MRTAIWLFAGVLLHSCSLFAQAPVVLPIEVLGPDGFVSDVSFTVDYPLSKINAVSLVMTVHGLEYAGQGAFQLNDNPWIPFSNDLLEPGLQVAYGGIGGGFSTLKFRTAVPLNTVISGTNHLRFYFAGTDGNSSGFRILNLNLLVLTQGGAGQTPLLGRSSFAYDNPNQWTAPLSDPVSIAEGQRLWRQASLVIQVPGIGAQSIQAHCSDCHAQDGRDLKYFNYSNYSIRARAIFHGLSGWQGDQIASYIRSLDFPNPGRPWNPPYQPGPGLDSQPVSNWAAGAGIGAVLNTDSAMLPYVSPTLSSADFDPAGNLNMRETPVAFQLLDWNHWLPRVHPVDVWGDAFTQSKLFTTYKQLRDGLAPGDPRAYSSQQYTFDDWSQYKNDFKASMPAPDFSVSAGATAMYSLDLWQITKMWELNQEFGLEGMARTISGPRGESRSWITNLPFHTAPNINRIPPGAPGIGNGSVGAFHYFSFMWYYSQLILNDSNKRPICTNPIDWGYFYGAVGDMSVASAPQAGLLTAMLEKALQISNNGQGPEVGCVLGWNPSINDPSRLTAVSLPNIWSVLPSSTTAALVNAYVGSWNPVLQRFTPQQFYDGGWTTPDEPVVRAYGDGNEASRFAYMIPRLAYLGLDPSLASSITNWAAQAWPGYDWSITQNATCSTDWNNIIRCSSDR